MIALEREGALWRVVIDRPDKANALTAGMLEEIAGHVEAARGAARVLVLTGRGKVFSAGADLEAARAGLALDPVWERLSGALVGFEGLSIAALNGTLAGGAFGMALACDIRIAVPGARFFYPAISLGFLPQPSDPPRLAALIGPARARMLLVAGQKIAAEEALAWGLVDRLVAPEEMTVAVRGLAAAALDAPPERVAAIKALIAARPG